MDKESCRDLHSNLPEANQALFLCTGYIFVIGYAALNLQAELSQWLFSVLHLFSGLVLLEGTMSLISTSSLTRTPSLAFILMSSLYYVASSTKYLVGLEVYRQFSLSNTERFLGSMAVFVVLVLCLATGRWVSGKLGCVVERGYLHESTAGFSRMLLFLLVADLVIKSFLVAVGYGPSYVASEYSIVSVREYWDLLFLTLSSITSDMVSILSAIVILSARKSLFSSRIILPILGLLFQLAWAMFMKSRLLILLPFLSIGICLPLLRGPRTTRIYLRWLIFFVFLLGTLGSAKILAFLGRSGLNESNTLYASIAEMGYRFDLSDFAISFLHHRESASPHFGIITDAVINMVPRALVPGKSIGEHYTKVLTDLGWPRVDYTDTLFSSGAIVAGWLGFVLVPLGFIVCIEVGYRALLALIKRIGSSVAFATCYLYLLVNLLKIELGWSELFLCLRAELIGITIILTFGWAVRLRGKRMVHYGIKVEAKAN